MNINDLILFARTADSGSITRAAEQLDISTAAASAALKRLEHQLGAQLFIRTTRQLRITSEGERFLVHCREALAQLEAGQASLHAVQGKVAGELRVSAPSDLGRSLLLGWIDGIMAEHPELSIHLTLGDTIADFYSDRVDVAVRYGPLEDSSMVAFQLATPEVILCAAPAYLAAHGVPETPADLRHHNCLLYLRGNRPHEVLDFVGSGAGRQRQQVSLSGNRRSNDSEVVRRWAVAGHGITVKAQIELAEDIAAGRLVQVLPACPLPQTELNLVCPNRNRIGPAVLLLRDAFRDKLAAI